jgi:hypothetical protein
VPISTVDFRSEKYTISGVSIEKNKTLLLGAPTNSNCILDIVEALDEEKVQSLDGSELMMVLPVSSDLSLSWSVHFTGKKFSNSSCPGMQEVSKLKQKGFKFSNGLSAIHNLKSSVEDGTVRILLDDKERTFSIAPEEWFPVDADGRQYDMSYSFVGCGGKTVIQLEKRQSGFNIVRLESDSENSSSTWIIQSSSKLKLGYYSESKFIFSADGINVVLTDAERKTCYILCKVILFLHLITSQGNQVQ